ncbi:MAG: hypothetical protein LBL43_03225 [Treponema sp.]|nr:hypothetical protein [Treponema sp.]
MNADSTGQKEGPAPPRCFLCVHFRVSGDPRFPRSCGMFRIKCRNLPSQEVFLSTGKSCPAFERKEYLK